MSGSDVSIVRQPDGSIRFESEDPQKAAQAAAEFERALGGSTGGDSSSPSPSRSTEETSRDHGESSATSAGREERLDAFLRKNSEFTVGKAMEVWAGREVPSRLEDGERNPEYHRVKRRVEGFLEDWAEENGVRLKEKKMGRRKGYEIKKKEGVSLYFG